MSSASSRPQPHIREAILATFVAGILLQALRDEEIARYVVVVLWACLPFHFVLRLGQQKSWLEIFIALGMSLFLAWGASSLFWPYRYPGSVGRGPTALSDRRYAWGLLASFYASVLAETFATRYRSAAGKKPPERPVRRLGTVQALVTSWVLATTLWGCELFTPRLRPRMDWLMVAIPVDSTLLAWFVTTFPQHKHQVLRAGSVVFAILLAALWLAALNYRYFVSPYGLIGWRFWLF